MGHLYTSLIVQTEIVNKRSFAFRELSRPKKSIPERDVFGLLVVRKYVFKNLLLKLSLINLSL